MTQVKLEAAKMLCADKDRRRSVSYGVAFTYRYYAPDSDVPLRWFSLDQC